VSCDIRRGKPRSQTCKKENTASSNPKIIYQAGVGGFKWTFRNYPTDENRALVVAKYAKPPLGTGWTASVTLQI
jgi:hypothetical protein